MSPDPFLGSGNAEEPQSWNRYAYGLNNPLMFVDPNGLDVKCPQQEGTDSGRPVRCNDNDVVTVTADAPKQKGRGSAPDYSGEMNWIGRGFAAEMDRLRPSFNTWTVVFPVASASFGAVWGGAMIAAPALAPGAAPLTLELGTAAAGAASTLPKWVDSAGAVVAHAQNLQRTGETVARKVADDLVMAARRFGVKIRLDTGGHQGTRWNMTHLNVGNNGQAHVPVPENYVLPH